MTQIIWPDNETKTLEELTRKYCAYPNLLGAENVVAIIPLYTNEAIDHITEVDKKCRDLSHVKSLHILGLRSSLAQAISDRIVPPHSEAERKAVRKLPGLSLSELHSSYSLIEDCSINGTCLSFTSETLAEYLAQILNILCENFEAVLTPQRLQDFQGWNLALGVSSLKYDVKHSIGLLDNLIWQEALTNAGFPTAVAGTERVEQLVATLFDIPKDCYERFLQDVSISTLRQTNSLERALNVSKIEIDKFFETLHCRLNEFVFSQDFSFKEREQTLSKLIHKDSDFEILSVLFGSSVSGTIVSNLQVESHNALLSEKELQLKDLKAEIERLQEHPFRHLREIKRLLNNQENLEKETARLRQDIQEAELMHKVGDLWSKKAYWLFCKMSEYCSSIAEFCRIFNALHFLTISQKGNKQFSETITLNNDSLLLRAFEPKKQTFLSLVDIHELFKIFISARPSFDEAEYKVKNEVLTSLQSYFSSFSIAEYLMGQEYPYLKSADCENLLTALHEKAVPTSHSSAPELPPMERLMFVGTDVQRIRTWKSATDGLQPHPTQTFSHENSSEIILLSIQPIPLEYCR